MAKKRGRDRYRDEVRRQARRAERFEQRIQRRLFRISVIVVVAALSISIFRIVDTSSLQVSPTHWSLSQLETKSKVSLTEIKGTPTVVTFFASWCTECQKQLPQFETVSLQTPNTVHFVGVNTLETSAAGTQMANSFALDNWLLLQDTGGANNSGLHDNFSAHALPTTVFYSAKGAILEVDNGGLTGSQLTAKLKSLFHVSV